MNITKFALTMFGVAAASLFAENFHLLYESVSLDKAQKARADYITATLPEVTIIGDRQPANQQSNLQTFNKEKGIIPFVHPALPGNDVFKKKGNIITFNTNVVPGLDFRIQLMASSSQIPLFSSSFEGLDNIHEEYINGWYKYTLGDFSTPGRSVPLFLKLEDKGYHDTFLVAYKDGKRVRVKDAMVEMLNQGNVLRR